MKTPMLSKKCIDFRKSNRKSSGQKELFLEIWESRPHVCEKCGKYLYEAKAHNFSHIKPKGMYPELKFEASNIELLFGNCHYFETTGLTNKTDLG